MIVKVHTSSDSKLLKRSSNAKRGKKKGKREKNPTRSQQRRLGLRLKLRHPIRTLVSTLLRQSKEPKMLPKARIKRLNL